MLPRRDRTSDRMPSCDQGHDHRRESPGHARRRRLSSAPADFSFAPSELVTFFSAYPVVARWAAFFRSFGAAVALAAGLRGGAGGALRSEIVAAFFSSGCVVGGADCGLKSCSGISGAGGIGAFGGAALSFASLTVAVAGTAEAAAATCVVGADAAAGAAFAALAACSFL